jgi:hypothetical protein
MSAKQRCVHSVQKLVVKLSNTSTTGGNNIVEVFESLTAIFVYTVQVTILRIIQSFMTYTPDLQQQQHDGSHLWSRNCPPFRSTSVHNSIFSEVRASHSVIFCVTPFNRNSLKPKILYGYDMHMSAK